MQIIQAKNSNAEFFFTCVPVDEARNLKMDRETRLKFAVCFLLKLLQINTNIPKQKKRYLFHHVKESTPCITVHNRDDSIFKSSMKFPLQNLPRESSIVS